MNEQALAGECAFDIEVTPVRGLGAPDLAASTPEQVRRGMEGIREALGRVRGPLTRSLGQAAATSATTANKVLAS
jgi:hypothetical protein